MWGVIGYLGYGWWVCSVGESGFYVGFFCFCFMGEVEVPVDLYDALLEEAMKRGTSLEEFINKLVEAALEK